MHKVSTRVTWAVVLLFTGLLSWNAWGTVLTAVGPVDQAANHSLVEKAACGGLGMVARCPGGQHWRCFGRDNCKCVVCPRFYFACPAGYCYKGFPRPGCYRC
jgi:hypothetical protein